MMCEKETYIFDLDGTLLDTLDDLADSVNYALRTHGLEERSRRDVRSFLGNGIRRLIGDAVGGRATREAEEEIFACFRAYYVEHCIVRTRPYDGIIPLLETLKKRGKKLAIVSNKLQPAVTSLARRFFGDYITVAIGEQEGVRRKPAPDTVLKAMELLHADKGGTLYVGDSEVDIETAKAAGVDCASVLWGFRDEDFLRGRFPEARFVHAPEELLG